MFPEGTSIALSPRALVQLIVELAECEKSAERLIVCSQKDKTLFFLC
jgi:hypothetical protein